MAIFKYVIGAFSQNFGAFALRMIEENALQSR